MVNRLSCRNELVYQEADQEEKVMYSIAIDGPAGAGKNGRECFAGKAVALPANAPGHGPRRCIAPEACRRWNRQTGW